MLLFHYVKRTLVPDGPLLFYFFDLVLVLTTEYYVTPLILPSCLIVIVFFFRLSGPNTGLAWISEGRRRVPLLPRGIAQTMYTEIADRAAEAAAAENKELAKKLEAEKLVAPKSNEEELPEAEGETAEGTLSSNDTADEMSYPIAMEDQTTKVSFLIQIYTFI